MTSPPADRYCDLVMKGGITSGIVYPPLAFRLAQHYRFKNIGGTSVGAVAAAATAAAEYRRRRDNNEEAFARLNNLPQELGAMEPSGSMTKLRSLFQPGAGCHRLFRVLTSALNATTMGRRLAAIVMGFLLAYWPATLAGVGLGLYAWRELGSLAGVLSLLLALLALIGAWVYRDITRNLVANNYGLCTGMSSPGSKHDGLTEWLYKLTQGLAGLPGDEPLTFGHLWRAPGFPPDWITLPPGETARSIDLRMFTTNLSTGRPFVLPLTNETCRLFYLPEELSPLLPQPVMDWLTRHSRDYAPNPDFPGSDPSATRAPAGLRELPAPEDFPVVLAARMSLSFPLLFSAIPLWAIDYDRDRGARTLQKCMFSDGGISSNFPIHLFDGLLPAWPTFGVQLEPKLPDRDNMIFLPGKYLEGFGERWNRFADAQRNPASRMGGFIAAIVSTMQNWNDNTLSRMPGVRDRVVRVRLKDKEGGLNLNMDPGIIQAVARRGDEAAQALIARFAAAPQAGTQAEGWDDQRWVRLGVALHLLQKRFAGVETALGGVRHATAYDDLIRLGQLKCLPGEDQPFTAQQTQALLDLLQAMRNFNGAFANPPHYSFTPVPEPDLRVRPSQ